MIVRQIRKRIIGSILSMNHKAQMKDEIHLKPSSYSHKTFSRLQKAAPGQQPGQVISLLPNKNSFLITWACEANDTLLLFIAMI